MGLIPAFTQQYVNILGVNISAINMSQAIQIIDRWISDGEQNYVCVTPAHGVMECYHQPELRKIFNRSGLTTPDGMGIVWLLKLKGHRHVSRVYGPDLTLAVCEHSVQRGWRHYFYGGEDRVADQLAENLKNRFPGLQIAGTNSPPFRTLTEEEDRSITEGINNTNADIIWVGVSTPKQEKWMSEHLGKVNATVMIGVGAAFDFLSGRKKQAPRWIQRSGLEWVFRFATEPRRLWKRYIQYPLFILLVIGQALGIRKYSVD